MNVTPQRGNTETNRADNNNRRELNCDQVVWVLDVFDRYLPKDHHPRISREREMKKYGMLYEVMEAASLVFSEDGARSNGTPHDARRNKP